LPKQLQIHVMQCRVHTYRLVRTYRLVLYR